MYMLIDNGIELERCGIIVQAIGEIKNDELSVQHFIFPRSTDGTDKENIDLKDLEEIAYFILSSTCSDTSFTNAFIILERLMSCGAHPADALEAFFRAKSRIIWGDIIDMIIEQCCECAKAINKNYQYK